MRDAKQFNVHKVMTAGMNTVKLFRNIFNNIPYNHTKHRHIPKLVMKKMKPIFKVSMKINQLIIKCS